MISTQKRISCGALTNTISIDTNGDCFPCAALHYNCYNIGNVFTEHLKDIYLQGQKLNNIFLVENIKECKECDFRYFCGGGCRARTLSEDNKITNIPDPFCPVIKSRMKEALMKSTIQIHNE